MTDCYAPLSSSSFPSCILPQWLASFAAPQYRRETKGDLGRISTCTVHFSVLGKANKIYVKSKLYIRFPVQRTDRPSRDYKGYFPTFEDLHQSRMIHIGRY